MFEELQVAGCDGTIQLARGPQFSRAGGSGPPLLFLHGIGRAWQDFVPLMAALAARWQVISYDQRGHGRSARTPGKYQVLDYARDTVSLARQFDRPVVLYGHSLGGLVAAAAAAQLGDAVRGVVLEDPPFGTFDAGVAGTVFESLFRGMQNVSGSKRSVAQLSAQLADNRIVTPDDPVGVRLGDVRDATAIRFGAACLKQLDPTVWDPLFDGTWMAGYDLQSILPGIGCPVLLLQGDVSQGGMLSDEVAQRAARLIPDCTRVPLAGVGHLIHNLSHELALRHTSAFLESISIVETVSPENPLNESGPPMNKAPR